MSETTRVFTLEQANSLLPQLEPMLADLLRLRQALTEASQRLAGSEERSLQAGRGLRTGDYVLQMFEFQALARAIQDVGCEVKDLDLGLIDFPSFREGRLVYLCWKRGEPRIDFWHEIDAGFAGRKPL